MMRSERDRYFRDEVVQQEYRDILDREEARREAAVSAARPPGSFDEALARFWEAKAASGNPDSDAAADRSSSAPHVAEFAPILSEPQAKPEEGVQHAFPHEVLHKENGALDTGRKFQLVSAENPSGVQLPDRVVARPPDHFSPGAILSYIQRLSDGAEATESSKEPKVRFAQDQSVGHAGTSVQARQERADDDLEGKLEVLKQTALAANETDSASFVASARSLIRNVAKQGGLSKDEVEQRVHEWSQALALSRLERLPPAELLEAVQAARAGMGYSQKQMDQIANLVNQARTGTDWKDPTDPKIEQDLTKITLPSGKIVKVHKKAAASFLGFLSELEASGYEIKKVDGYASRFMGGKNKWSQHAWGVAIDINPYQLGNGFDYRLRTNLPANITAMAAKWGLSWGGNWKRKKDAMHF